MGMFDTVNIKCPNCGQLAEIQTKSGECMLEVYTPKTAPVGIMVSLEGLNECYHCYKWFVVEMVQKPKFVVRKMTEEEEKNFDEMGM